MALYQTPRRSAALAAHFPVYDFLAPSLLHIPQTSRQVRCISSTPKAASSAAPNNAQHGSLPQGTTPPKSGPEAAKNTAPLTKPLTQEQRDFLTSALRVNQAGELAATLIYTAQTPVVVNQHPHLRPLMKHMYDQEAGHFKTFNQLLAKHRIRPTAMYPLWKLAATGLGWSTAIMGREAAMACTEAVETEIGTHYNTQVQYLLQMTDEMKAKGEELGPELTELVGTLRRIRDEELEHLDHAVEHDAKKAVPHELLTGIIRAGCRGAIWVSERV